MAVWQIWSISQICWSLDEFLLDFLKYLIVPILGRVLLFFACSIFEIHAIKKNWVQIQCFARIIELSVCVSYGCLIFDAKFCSAEIYLLIDISAQYFWHRRGVLSQYFFYFSKILDVLKPANQTVFCVSLTLSLNEDYLVLTGNPRSTMECEVRQRSLIYTTAIHHSSILNNLVMFSLHSVQFVLIQLNTSVSVRTVQQVTCAQTAKSDRDLLRLEFLPLKSRLKSGFDI